MTSNPFLIAYLVTVLLVAAGIFQTLGESALASTLAGAAVGFVGGARIERARPTDPEI